jgi:hypothetical protein
MPDAGSAMETAGIATMGAEMDGAAKAGLPSVLCISEGCTASFDLRPTRPKGGRHVVAPVPSTT